MYINGQEATRTAGGAVAPSSPCRFDAKHQYKKIKIKKFDKKITCPDDCKHKACRAARDRHEKLRTKSKIKPSPVPLK